MGYWPELWGWYEDEGGYGHVAAYLRGLDISSFNAKAPPIKTPAFWDMVDAGRAPEECELADIIDLLGNPKAFTLDSLKMAAGRTPIGDWLHDRKNRRQIPHRLAGVGYTAIRNEADKRDGQWKVGGSRQMVYALADLSKHERCAAATELSAVTLNKTVWDLEALTRSNVSGGGNNPFSNIPYGMGFETAR